MANYANAKANIAANVYQNNNNEVTANMVKAGINAVVDTLISGGYLNAGIAHPDDAAVTPDANVFYFAIEAGTYVNKGGIVVADGEVAVLKYNGTWSKEITGAATAAQVIELGQKLSDEIFDLSNSIVTSKNLLNKDNCVPGALDASGNIGSQSYYRTTDYIRLKAGQVITCSNTLIRLFEYDLDKNIILSATASNVNTHTQINDGYIRASFGTAVLDSIVLVLGTQLPDTYSPYRRVLQDDVNLNDNNKNEVLGIVKDGLQVVTEKAGLPLTFDITDSLIWENGHGYNTSGEVITGAIKCAKINVSYQDIIKIVSSANPTSIVVFNKQGQVVTSLAYSGTMMCPQASDYVYITLGNTVSVTKVEQTSNELINNASEVTYSTNYFDRNNIVVGYSVNSSTGAETPYAEGFHTNYIPVAPGKVVVFGDGIKNIRYMRIIAAYDAVKNLLPNAGNPDGSTRYVVPDGVYYIILSISNSNLHDDSRINVIDSNGRLLRFEPYSESLMPKGTMAFNRLAYRIKNEPITAIPSLLNSLCYKPLGVLSRPYVCLTSDDGYPQMATHSIPMAIRQDIPITFYIMKGSPVLENTDYIETIESAIASGHCELGQHGYTPFVDYNEDQLNAYFESEKEYWDSLGFEMKSSATPTGVSNNIVNAVCGARFGVNRNANAELYYGGTGCFANGPRSNIYALSSLGIKTHSLDTMKLYADLAFDNNWLLVVHFHDFDFDGTAEGDALYQKYEDFIIYAKAKGMTFITASQIPTII